jgi:RNA polymerase sigma factor (sigma-70 family)
MNITALIREAREASPAAQQCLFELLSARMSLVCRRYVKSREDAEEIMLDGFYKFFKNLAAFDYQGEKMMEAWLKKIMVNECLMFLRKKKAFIIVTESAAEDITLEEEALDNMSAAEIFNLIVQLPVGYRTVFNLYEIEGMNHKEIAVLMGISEGTSKSQLSKAKSLLQKMLLQKGITNVNQKTK